MKKILPFASLLILFSACQVFQQAAHTETGQSNMLRKEMAYNDNYISESLFQSKESTISEMDIQRLLDGKIRLPDTVRVAILHYGSNTAQHYYTHYWTNEDYLKLRQSYLNTFEGKLLKTSRVGATTPVPSLILSRNPDIVNLREAAVRLQADMLLIFTIRSDIYYKYKMFKKNEAKAFATCEALLMDIRTGVIPFAEVITRDKLIQKADVDLSDNELRMRAENEATQITIIDMADKLKQYFEGL